MGRYRSTITDYSSEKSVMSIFVDNAAPSADLTAFYAATDAIVIGNMGDGILTTEVVNDAGTPGNPTSPFAQRELKWLCRYSDVTTGASYQFEIPTPDLDQLSGNVDTLDLTAGVGLTFKNEFEDVAESPVGNAVVLNSVTMVGRNN